MSSFRPIFPALLRPTFGCLLSLGVLLACSHQKEQVAAAPPASPAAPQPAPASPSPGADVAKHDELKPPPLEHFGVAWTDKSVEPCQDFFAHVCGKWLKSHPIPQDQVHWSTGSAMQRWNETILRQLLESARAAPRDAAERQLGTYYGACLEAEPSTKNAALGPVGEQLARIDALKTKSELPARVAEIHALTLKMAGGPNSFDDRTGAPLFGYGPFSDFTNPRDVVSMVDQGGWALGNRDAYLSDGAKETELREKYRGHVAKMLELAGTPEAQAKKDAESVLRVETAFARGSMDVVKRRDPHAVNHGWTYAQLQHATPSFDWNAYFAAVETWAPGFHRPSNVLVATPEFMKVMEAQLKAEPVETWKAYLRWWSLHLLVSSLPDDFVAADFEFFSRALRGAKEPRPRWRRCVAMTDRDLGSTLGEAYAKKVFPEASKRQVENLVAGLKRALDTDIEGLDWLGATAKEKARHKLSQMQVSVGYPTPFVDQSSIAVGADKLANAAAAARFEQRRQLAKIGKPVDRNDWQMTVPTVDAYNDPQLNAITFPAGILLPPVFDAADGAAANYGSLGAVIGHEIIHGYDDQGRKFDAQGRLRDEWTPADLKHYQERSQCIAHEYTGPLASLGVSTRGELTLGEDTADNGGLRIALAALQADLASRGEKLDDVGPEGLTHLQRFFGSFAFSWCGAGRPEVEREQVLSDPHSLNVFRVNNVVANQPEFAHAFSCKAGAPMVHAPACRVW